MTPSPDELRKLLAEHGNNPSIDALDKAYDALPSLLDELAETQMERSDAEIQLDAARRELDRLTALRLCGCGDALDPDDGARCGLCQVPDLSDLNEARRELDELRSAARNAIRDIDDMAGIYGYLACGAAADAIWPLRSLAGLQDTTEDGT